MTCLKSFVDDLAANEKLRKMMPAVGDDMWAALKKEAALDTSRIWTEHAPPDGWDDIKAGVFASAKNGSSGITDPVDILDVDADTLMILNYGSLPALYTKKGIFLDVLPYGTYSAAADDGIYRCQGGGDVRDFGAEKRVLICCTNNHTVVAFDHATGQQLWKFGTNGQPGNPADDKLYTPRGGVWLPNGNALISCYQGTGDSTDANNRNYGYIVELAAPSSGLTADVIRIVATNTVANRGQASRGGVYNPTNIARGLHGADEVVYICNIGSEEVGAFIVDDTGAWAYRRTYKKPTSVEADAIDPWACCPAPDATDPALCVYSGGMRAIAAIGIDSGAVVWHTGMPGWDNRAHPVNNPHELDTVYGLMWDDPNQRVLAADYGNKRVMALTKSNEHTIQYTVTAPEGYELDVYPKGYDPVNHTLTVPVNEVKSISYSCRANKAGHMVLGWSKIAT